MTTTQKESPYQYDKILKMAAEITGIDTDEFAPSPINPNENKTHYLLEPKGMKPINYNNIPDDTEVLVWPACCSEVANWENIPKEKLPKSIHTLYLGHDGIIRGSKNDFNSETYCREILSYLSNLKVVHSCYYYGMDLNKIAKDYPHIEFIDID